MLTEKSCGLCCVGTGVDNELESLIQIIVNPVDEEPGELVEFLALTCAFAGWIQGVIALHHCFQ